MTKEQHLKITKLIKQGDNQAEVDLISYFNEKIKYKVCTSIGYKNNDWQDVVNDIEIALIESLRKGLFKKDIGIPLGSYVYGITQNKIRDYFKMKSKNKNMYIEQSNINDITGYEEFILENEEIRSILKELLTKLKIKYKEALYLRYYEELSISQISKKIKIHPRRVSERINYALKLLRKECKKENYFSILRAILIINI